MVKIHLGVIALFGIIASILVGCAQTPPKSIDLRASGKVSPFYEKLKKEGKVP